MDRTAHQLICTAELAYHWIHCFLSIQNFIHKKVNGIEQQALAHFSPLPNWFIVSVTVEQSLTWILDLVILWHFTFKNINDYIFRQQKLATHLLRCNFCTWYYQTDIEAKQMQPSLYWFKVALCGFTLKCLFYMSIIQCVLKINTYFNLNSNLVTLWKYRHYEILELL